MLMVVHNELFALVILIVVYVSSLMKIYQAIGEIVGTQYSQQPFQQDKQMT
jgi:hypothetical protein